MGNNASISINNDNEKSNLSSNKNKNKNVKSNKKTKKKELKCKMPIQDNPAMNYLNTDFNTNNANIKACKLTKSVDKKMRKIINSGVGKHLNSMDKIMNERQFITMPWTTQINDQTKFANWLYKDLNKCKSEHKNCGKNTIRSHIYLYDNND
jgi:hypothetical protein